MGDILTIVGVTVVGMLVGMVWYSPVLFGSRWQQLVMRSGVGNIKVGSSPLRPLIVSFVATLISASVLWFVIDWLGLAGVRGGMLVAGWMWLGFVAAPQLTSSVFENRPFALYAINTLHHLVVLLVMGALLAIW